MWYNVQYELEEDGITPHVVQGDLLEWHNEYILKEYNKAPKSVTELTEAFLDPGGMLIMGTKPLSFKLNDDEEVKVKKEHVWTATDFFFNREIYEIAKAHTESKIHPDLRMRVINNKIEKVYLSYYILVLNVESYLSICDFLESEYLNGMNEYLDMMDRLMLGEEISKLLEYVKHLEPGEA